VLEIGCGTGQLSVPLAQHGAELVAVELGPSLATVARRNVADFPAARVEVGGFEEWPVPADPFDVVVSASALHRVRDTPSWVIPRDIRTLVRERSVRRGGWRSGARTGQSVA
jgi:cyclopropane fatty-acyl-phospholipid synthase-like methyltransferase